MKKNKEYNLIYAVALIFAVTVTTIGSTYAYMTARTNSEINSVRTNSTTYSISIDITPLYESPSIIPMNDEYALKAIKNRCVDKYNYNVCYAYTIRVYDYDEKLDYVSGLMDIETTNMTNLSYMTFSESDTYNPDNCLELDNKYYCKVVNPTHMGTGTNLPLGDSYDVAGKTETKIILLIWLTNLNERQNEIDIGRFNATITMQAGNGGKIQGSIANALVIEEGGNSNG